MREDTQHDDLSADAAADAAGGTGSTKAGYVAILGRPNVGKSTLLNRLVEEKISITSPKPQTTRRRVAGIRTRGTSQVVFLDTPGILDPSYPLQRALAGEVRRSVEGVDLAYLVNDATEFLRATSSAPRRDADLDRREREVLRSLRGVPVFLVLNKADLVQEPQLEARHRARGAEPAFSEVHVVSALTGAGVEELLEATVRRLPAASFFFDPEQLTDHTMRFLVAELVRESLFDELEQELPYASHVEVTAYEEGRAVPRIEATIYVERESQKGIVIGRGGESLKRIGTAARRKIEGLAGQQVFLQLFVKVRPNWRRREADLRRFGYRI